MGGFPCCWPPVRLAPPRRVQAPGFPRLRPMTSFRAGRAVILVLDALGPEAVAGMPQLVRLAERGAMAPLGGLAELVASTGPGHATLLTGQSLASHGVLANRIFDEDGAVDRDPRVRVPTLMD